MTSDSSGSGGRASRRTFLTGAGAAAAGAGALAAGLVGAAPADAATPAETDRTEHTEGAAEPIVAYVSDPATGEITLMSGEREVTVVDHQLTRAFARKVR